jgi:hypothetical protein
MGDRPSAFRDRRRRTRLRRIWGAAIVAAAFVLVGPSAHAEPHDTAAEKMRKGAMYTDYIQLDFAVAEKKLDLAIALCQAATDCSHAVRAELFLDAGVVDFAQQKVDEGRAQFAKAIAENPAIALSADFSTPELQKEFAAIKAKTGGMAKESIPLATPPPSTPEPSEPAAPGETPHVKDADCPPGFPGCNSEPTPCDSDAECLNGQKCENLVCVGGEKSEDTGSKPFKKNWVSVAFQEDFLLLPTTSIACAGNSGYTCFTSSANYSTNAPIAGFDDTVTGGMAPATMTILAGYDRSLNKNFQIGGRAGFILGGGPSRPATKALGAGGAAFLPLHLEARVTYWFGKNPLGRSGFRFFLVAAGGIGEVDSKEAIDDCEAPLTVFQCKAGKVDDYNAWKKTGTGFVGLGAGMMFAFTPITGILLEVKNDVLFPTVGESPNAQLGYAIGF